ncbi:MAG TPA: DNA mismatch repair protein MutS [Bacillota bacterium]|jgi:DNA mismatch repair protein MutS|nr:DNA mismatch repair protein MutS [Fastidiosipila sp.]HPX93556.1 DNA mismatch repair protein MutS [Bacillota bacterium]HQB81842.1 DNA mismatch repair protein MutS [Bacillota bacterium]
MSLTFDQIDKTRITPMMRQLIEVKEKHPDCLIFFRLGDFYELFFDDALTASRELELALTGRDCGLEDRAPMCGVPHHAADSYLKKLLARGYKVAVCDQVEDPAEARGLVDREVVRILTPGTQIDPDQLDSQSYRYLCAVCQFSDAYGLAACDLSSGRFETTEMLSSQAEVQLFDELSRLKPVEYLVNERFAKNTKFLNLVQQQEVIYTVLADDIFGLEEARQKGLTFSDSEMLWPRASAALLTYLENTQKKVPGQIGTIQPYALRDYMLLDRSTRSNLEITETIRDRKRRGSLLWAVDRTQTAMGARLLRSWLEQPLIDPGRILRRQSSVASLLGQFVSRQALRDALAGLYDIERLSGKIASGTVNPRDLSALKGVLERLPGLRSLLEDFEDDGLRDLYGSIFELKELASFLSAALADDPPLLITEGGIFRPGFNEELDQLADAAEHGRDFLLSLEAKEREATGIKNLKVGYNRVFGYYYEVSRGQLDKVPGHFTRKQTLVNSERFITPELKEKEDKILGADQKRKALEYELFTEIRSKVARDLPQLQATARALARLDVLLSLAEVADKHKYCRPEIRKSRELVICGGRHCVVEQTLRGKSDFVANDLELDGDERRVMVLTGPNMSGKSTYMRQAAIIVLLAQVGSFVPADSAVIGIVDRIMTRVGASDDLAGGQSTFMVEMTEVALILDQASPTSLLILDEIGRGTGTADGLSIAWSVIEYISDPALLGARALFATHYHELIDLGNRLPGVFNAHFDVAERDGDIVFLHQVRPGGANESYGIDVAKLAGVPGTVVDRARELMAHLEQTGRDKRRIVKRQARAMDGQQDLFSGAQSVRTADQIIGRLEEADIDNMRPVDAYGLLIDLKELALRRKRQSMEEKE